ncbi:FCP1-like proteiny domain [Sesbania bispinosa]|nr:FCP1-like proteiny domain [Sesbania bispinosa]
MSSTSYSGRRSSTVRPYEFLHAQAKRPGLDEFLDSLPGKIKVVVFTAVSGSTCR